MIWCYIISLVLFILFIALYKSTKESDSYHYKEESAKYWKMPLWMLLLIIIVWMIPYVNLGASVTSVIGQVFGLMIMDNIKLVPKENTFFGKLLKFLTKEI